MRLFDEGNLSQYLANRCQVLEKEVSSEPKQSLLNLNEIEYRDYLFEKYSIEPLNFQWELMDVSDREEPVRAEQFPPGAFNVVRGRSYLKQILSFHIPFIGEQDLLSLKPSSFIMWTHEVRIAEKTICIEFINFWGDPEAIRREFESIKDRIQRQLRNVLDEVVLYNTSLSFRAEHAIKSRKEELLRMSNLLESLGVPVRRADSVPEVFQVPVKKKSPIVKPKSSSEPFEPEPSLGNDLYMEILKICRQVGIEMERHPSIYFDKTEETLRDHFLMVLSPHFHSVTGEAFNKAGKTDILIRHEQYNVFIAEFKFWKGVKSFHSAIKQILGYLTWRDSKAALVFFVRNKDIDSVIESVTTSAQTDEDFVAFNGMRSEGWLEFEFRLSGDNPRRIRLALLLFHFPS